MSALAVVHILGSMLIRHVNVLVRGMSNHAQACQIMPRHVRACCDLTLMHNRRGGSVSPRLSCMHLRQPPPLKGDMRCYAAFEQPPSHPFKAAALLVGSQWGRLVSALMI